MKKYFVVAVLMILSSLSTSLLASSNNVQSYTFVEIAYMDYEEPLIKTDGFVLKGSLAFNDQFFIFIEHSETSGLASTTAAVNPVELDIDLSTYGLGIGINYDIGSYGSSYASYSKGRWEIEELGAEVDVNIRRIGYRHKFSEMVNLSGGYVSRDFETIDREQGFEFSIAYLKSDILQFNINYEKIGDIKTITLGTRFFF